jgi:hypothetical protein
MSTYQKVNKDDAVRLVVGKVGTLHLIEFITDSRQMIILLLPDLSSISVL